ncbi:MAG: MBL fold metallo-hydrolase [Treponema sp.]|jgi:glyoxylase-like metal-dependent hydrolase (beta-lactamase superfamily II)|nr:MBL fold metallo-hydrolase [Treponema sp.]
MAFSQDNLVQLSDTFSIITGVTNIGVISDGISDSAQPRHIYLIDSGGDGDTGKKILRLLSELYGNNFVLQGIINTHSHADHAGGNAWLQTATHCEIWASQGEKAIIENPQLESALVWGACPFPEIRSKFFEAKPSSVTRIIAGGEKIELRDSTMEIISLPGHYIDMIGILHTDKQTGKSAVHLGDGAFGRETIAKYWIAFLHDVEGFKASLEKINAIHADYFVPSHGAIFTAPEALTEINSIAVREVETTILRCLKEKLTPEELLAKVADINSIPLGYIQYVLVGSTLRSYLSYLYRNKKIGFTVENNRMYWQAHTD